MAGCSDCHRAGRLSSRIPQDVLEQCGNNQRGTCVACNKLTDIQCQIVKARRALDQLLDEQERMASCLNKHHDPLIRRLPPEIASRIFLHSLPYQPSTTVFDSDFKEDIHIKTLFKLGHICRHWREVAQSTPELWTIFSATISKTNCVSSVQLSQDWLERSRRLPLFLMLRVNDSANKVVSGAGRRVVASALFHSQRLKVLGLKVPTFWLNWITEKLSSQSMDRLEHLIFGIADEITGGEHEVLRLKASPRSLTLFPAWLDQVSIDWSQITRVSAGTASMTLEECTRIFRDAPRISYCHLHDIVDNLGSVVVIVGNPSLLTLVIQDFSDAFWNHFSFPSLDTLDVADAYHEGENRWVHLESFIRRSGCSLKTLRVKGDGNDQQALVEALKLMPDLEELTLRGEIHGESFFPLMDDAAISADVANSVFMGKLRSLQCVTFQSDYDWSWLIVFLNTMTSRKKGSLQSFLFHYLPNTPVTYHHLITLEKEIFKLILDVSHGLQFRIVGGRGFEDLLAEFSCMYGYDT